MKALVACLASLALALALGPSEPAPRAHSLTPGVAGYQLVAPAAPAKATPKPKKTPKPKPSASPTATPSPSPSVRQRSQAEIEGDRWVQIAVIGGGGLLGSVLVFFAIGALMRRKARPR